MSSLDQFLHSHPPFTKTTHRDVYAAIDPTNSKLSLAGKTVLVTGGGRGIGLGIVESFAKAGVKTIVVTGRTEASLTNIKGKIESAYPRVQVVVGTADIGSRASVDKFFQGLQGKVSSIDVLVNNAGVMVDFGPKVGEADPDNWWSNYEVNTRGPFLVTRGVIQLNPEGHNLTVISLVTGAVAENFPGGTGYVVSKATLIKFAEILAGEYPNVRPFVFSPGLVNTDMMAEAFKPLALDTPALSGGLSVWLSSPEADFLKGRFVDAHWDVTELAARKEEIERDNLLKYAIRGW